MKNSANCVSLVTLSQTKMNKLFLFTPALLVCAQLAATPAVAAPAAAPAATETAEAPTPAQMFEAAQQEFETLYSARSGNRLSEMSPVTGDRPWLETIYAPADAAKLDEAIGKLRQVSQSVKRESPLHEGEDASKMKEFDLRLRTMAARATNDLVDANSGVLAMALLERAQFVTNQPADYEAVLVQFESDKAAHKATDPSYNEQESWKKAVPFLATELRANVGARRLPDAMKLYYRWSLSDDAKLSPEIALPVMVEALDAAGDFNTARALIMESAINQVRADHGYEAGNQTYQGRRLRSGCAKSAKRSTLPFRTRCCRWHARAAPEL